MSNIVAILNLSAPLFLILIAAVVAIFVFEVAMLISAIRNKYISDSAKLFWVLGMLVIHPLVAIAYYFTDYKKTN